MRSFTWLGRAPTEAALVRLGAAGFTRSRQPDGAGPAVVATAHARQVPQAPAGPWVWFCTSEVPQSAVAQAIRRGAYDVLSASRPGDLELLVRRLGELDSESPRPPSTPGLIAESAAAQRMLEQAWRAARTRMPVFITGETGTGKEVLAGLIHRWSGLAGAYVAINCAAIPNELMESELFGHIRGAFSGAVATVDGKLLAAQGGSVFLDEIDDTPLNIQNKLLRVLEDGQVTRVGESKPRKADFRLITATNRDLQPLISAGRFGLDFFERLATVRIELPRLAERRDDLPFFVRHFIARFYEHQGVPPAVTAIAPAALAALLEHSWPGNIRELRNVIYQALVYKRAGSELLLSDLRALLDRRATADAQSGALVGSEALRARIEGGRFNLRREVEALERESLRVALDKAGGRPAQAARLLGEVGRGTSRDPAGTVRAMMKRLRLQTPG
jgi:DNA-binding NtrC family response regulator